MEFLKSNLNNSDVFNMRSENQSFHTNFKNSEVESIQIKHSTLESRSNPNQSNEKQLNKIEENSIEYTSNSTMVDNEGKKT